MAELEINQVGGLTYFISGKIDGEFIEARAVVTKKGNLQKLLGEGSVKYKKNIVRTLHLKNIVNDTVLKLNK